MSEGKDYVNKSDICKAVAADLDYREGDVKKVVDEFLKKIMTTVCDDNKVVRINGFAMFEPYVQPARKGRNPKTGEIEMRPETTLVKCRISNVFKDYMKGYPVI